MSTFYDGKGNSITISSGSDDSTTSGGGDVTATCNDFLTGKTWLVVGDSITNYPGYRPMIVEKYNMTELCAHEGGRRVGYGGSLQQCVLERLDDIPEGQPDVITIALGSNDAGDLQAGNIVVGTINDDYTNQSPDNFTFYGCYKALIIRLFERYGYDVPMLLITPYPRKLDTSKITNAIKEIGEYYSIPVFDQDSESGAAVGILTDTGTGNLLFTTDGTHTNPHGASIVAPRIADKMNLIIQRWEFPCRGLQKNPTSPVTLTSVGATKNVYAYGNPRYTTDFNKIVWECSDESVATIKVHDSFFGAKVTAVANGTCTVTAKVREFTVTHNITVAAE